MYVRLAITGGAKAARAFGAEWMIFASRTPRFFPHLGASGQTQHHAANVHPAAKPAGYAPAFSFTARCAFALLTLGLRVGLHCEPLRRLPVLHLCRWAPGFGLRVALYSHLRQLARPST